MRKHSIYPVKESVAEAVAHIEAQLPIHSFNQFYALMMVYENSRRQDPMSFTDPHLEDDEGNTI